MVSLNPTSVNIQTIILGNILAIAPEDIIQLAAIGFISMAILLLKWKDLMVTFFDENHARSIGLNTSGLKLLFFTLLAACTVAALQTVGAFLVICLVVTPGATAWLLTDRFPRLLAIAVAIGSLTSFFGAWLSYYLDGATGGIIVVAQTLLFLATFVFAPKHGLLANRRRAREACMLTMLLEPLQFPFMVNAMLVATIVAVPCALLSVFLVLKGWALMGDAMSHAVFPGVVVAYIIGIPFAIGAFIAGSILRRRHRFSRR